MNGASNGLLHDGLSYWARRAPDRLAAVMDEEDGLTYAALDRWSDAVAADLQARGVVPDDRVGMVAANCMEWVVAAFAILKCGAVAVPFNDRFLAEELGYVIGMTDPRIVIADEPRRAVLAGVAPDRPCLAMETLAAHRDTAPLAGFARVRASANATAMIIYTSGSTSHPKGAMMSHQNYLAKFAEMRSLDASLGPETRSLMPFGLHSSPGLPWGILFTSTLGGTLHFTRKYKAADTLATLERHRIGFFIGAPIIYDQIARLPGFATADLSALRFARVGGAAVSEATLARWRGRDVVVRQLYGMTEMGGGAIIASAEEALAHPDSCGRGLASTEIRILRDDGTHCDPGEAGHILLRGPGMMTGYWRDPDATAAAIGDGWMHTGDIGTIDAAGYFRFVDRSKEMIKSGGYNVSPAEIEAVLAGMDGVLEAAVFAVADEGYGEAPCACVFARPGVTARAVFDHCAARLAGFKLPRYVVPLDRPLPRLANEKIDRRRLKADHADIARRVARLSSR